MWSLARNDAVDYCDKALCHYVEKNGDDFKRLIGKDVILQRLYLVKPVFLKSLDACNSLSE